MIYMEPTHYILGLVQEISSATNRPVQILFLHQDISQPWGLSLAGFNASVSPQGRLAAMSQVYRRITERPAVLHLAGWGHSLLLFAMIVGWFLRVPVVVESDTQLPLDQPVWKRTVKAVMYPGLFRLPAMFLPGGSRQAEYIRHYGVPEKKILVARMTVDVAGIQQRCAELGTKGRGAIRERLGLDDQAKVFVFVGRLVAIKGIADLLDAFEQVSRRIPDLALVVVGDGPERDRVVNAARENGAIRWTGRLDPQGVIEMFHAADVAVVPSHVEPWGLVVNEAMAAGLPVIASNRVGAVDDLVRDGETGIVFTAGDVDGLVQAMADLSLDRALRDRYAVAGRRLIAGWTLADSARTVLRAWKRCGFKETPG